jgi:hypothetical protein
LILLAGAVLLSVVPANADAATGAGTGTPVLFGMDSASMADQAAAGVKADYATFWIGPWTLNSGWGGPDGQLTAMKDAGVTPAIHFYYWGDDITPTCVENGCWSSLHNAQKTRAGWETLGTQMTDHLTAKMGGKPVVVFLESEFNKGGISSYEPFDGYLAAMSDKLHAGYPNAIVVLGYGNWDDGKWGNFDRAVAASDMVGLQAMRGSTKDSAAAYDALYDGTLAGVKKLKALFPGTPIMLTDVALSSYPEATYTQEQADNLGKFFTGMAALKSAGVTAIIYRSWHDSPNMDLANYYGQAERHWGLATASQTKPSGQVWIDGVKAERAGGSPAAATPTPAPTGPYSATFTTHSASNQDWVQEKVVATPGAAKVDLRVNGGAWQPLKLQSYGDWTVATHIAMGSEVVFRALAADGRVSQAPAQQWLGAAPAPSETATPAAGGGSSPPSATASAAPAAAPGASLPDSPAAFTATFAPQRACLDWWIETEVRSDQPIALVEASLDGGAWMPLPMSSWGTYVASVHAPDDTSVVFRATSTDGSWVTSPAILW